MGLLTPMALGFLSLALPIILFYMLKLRRQETLVSSTFLWRQALRDLQANAPWQRLRRNLLLLLQLLILALLVLASARPFYESPSLTKGNVIVLLDASASMKATDVKPSRFEAAKSIINRIVDDLGSGDQITIVLVAGQAEVVVSNSADKPTIKRALAALEAKNSTANFSDAIALAVASAERIANSSVVIVGDGGLGNILIDRVPVPVRYVPVGVSSNNVAISSIAARDGAHGAQLFLGLSNYDETPSRGRASIYVNGQLHDSREFALEPGAESGFGWDGLPPDTELVQARVEVADELAVDNTAWTLRAPAAARKVLLVSGGNLFLERALSLLPGVELSKMPPDSSTPPEGFDLYVLDGVVPALMPPGGILFVNPSQDQSLFSVIGDAENLAVTRQQTDDPILRFVNVSDLRVAKARQIAPPEWSRTILQSGDVPLLLVGEKDGRRIAVMPFDVHASNLPLLVAFPILTTNIVDWLEPSGSHSLLPETKAGDPLTLGLDPKAREVEIRRPDGSRWKAIANQASVTYAETDWLGVYEVVQHLDGGGSKLARFVVSLADPLESDITPSKSIPLQGQDSSGIGEALMARREMWWPLIAAALAVLILEWGIDQRRHGRRRSIHPPATVSRTLERKAGTRVR